jgi:hypothetical protein
MMHLRPIPCVMLLFYAALACGDDMPSPSPVTITRAVPRGNARTPIFDVQLSYSFKQRPTVWLRGIGLLPGEGKVEYTIRGTELVFSDREKGQTLARVPVKATEIEQTPATGDTYASTVIASGWTLDAAPVLAPVSLAQAPSLLLQRLSDTYGQYAGPTPCRPDDQGCLLTQWISITPPAAWTQAQMAVMMTYTGEPSRTRTTSIRIYYQARQAPVGEKEHWDYKIDTSIRQAVLDRVASLRKLLAGPGKIK